ncbi:Ham1-like protein [Candidatus Omnitrophus magneticus]|uniref:dITP/XTP pyrophosphatase n=1 Tax=Candidatus Omnitrophus magneticus TaxID=1609969 RepID=A0A0F0CUA6_9BACT|nr:Ham1-like protein [Candidatus Omnitrophus magneticus]
MNILVATGNENKRKEIESILQDIKDIVIMKYTDLKIPPPKIIEDGKTFRENAIKKSVTVSKFFSGLVIADDSGLEVDALLGKPGVRSARFARINATDEENNKKLLNLMGKIETNKRSARFVCYLALSKNGKLLETSQGEIDGSILTAPKGQKGFGYDPLFVPNGYEKTFAEMGTALKNKISHRSQALKNIKPLIFKYI